MLLHPGHTATRRGVIAPWVLLGLGVLLAILALGMDGGRMMDERRHLQSTADAAALAAGANLYENWWKNAGKDIGSGARTAALNVAAANGYTNDGVNSTVTVNVPPKSGTFTGQAEYAEVIVERKLPRTFGAVLTGGDPTLRSRAVATGRPVKMGLIMLRRTGADAFLNRSLAFAVLGNPIVVNSSDPAAFNQASLGLLVASKVHVTGGLVNTGGGIILGNIRTGVRPTADPLRRIPPPDATAYVVRSNNTLNINSLLPTILKPGVYRGGITVSGISIVIMQPGVYIMEGGGFEVKGLATVTGLDVLLYNTTGTAAAGPVTITTLGKVVLLPPTGGTYQGIGIFQDRTLTQALTIQGGGGTVIAGTVYAARAHVALTGLVAVGVDTLGGAYVCESMEVSGVGSINIDLGNNYPRVPDVNLVE